MMPLVIRGRTLNPQGRALVCMPLVARTAEALQAELASILPKEPDLIEWRVDYFDAISDPALVVETAKAIRKTAGPRPILFTRRAVHEGGEAIGLSEESVVALYEEVCKSGVVDIIDYELSQSAKHRAGLRAISRAHGIAMIMSYHNFSGTPPFAELVAKMVDAERQGADIAKVAVMPGNAGDALLLLQATLEASQRVRIPLITMSMGGMGAMTRLCGWMFGSAVTFAAGESSSAPGQIPAEDLRAALKILERAWPDRDTA